MIFFGSTFIGFLESIIWVILAVLFSIPVLYMGPTIENYILGPVISDMHIQKIGEEGKQYSKYILTFNKNRSCDPLADSFAWYADDGTGYERIFFESPTKFGDVPRPEGLNKTGTWKVDNLNKKYVSQKLVFFHQCHFLWKTKTEIVLKADGTK